MPKIKNWSYAGEVGPMGEPAWFHDADGSEHKVDIENYGIGEWCISHWDGSENRVIGNATNERDAREIAVEWMRTNPKPEAL